jgi:hypothetical protein
VADLLPTGLTATAISGTGWTTNLAALTATRSDVLGPSASYPALTVTVNVAANAPASVTNTVTVSGGGELNTANDTATDPTTITPTSFLGTSGDDTFTFTAGGTWYEVVVTLDGGSPTTYRYPVSETTNITFNGNGGNDSVTLNGGPGDETADLYPDHGTFTGTGYSVSVSNVASITAKSGGGNDQATLHDGPQADTFVGYPTYAVLSGPGVSLWANGFRSVTANAAAGGQDVARLYDSSGNDTFTAYPTYATLTNGTTYSTQANDFRYVMAYATLGGTDVASFFDSPGNDTFTAYPTYATMTGTYLPTGATVNRSYYNRAQGFGTYQGTSSAGGTMDLAKLYDSATSSDQSQGAQKRNSVQLA